MNLDERREIIIFESFFTTYKAMVIFEAADCVEKIGSRLIPDYHKKI